MDDKMYVAHIPGDVEVEATFAIPSRPAPIAKAAEMPAVAVTEAHLEVSEAALPALHAQTILAMHAELDKPLPGHPGVNQYTLSLDYVPPEQRPRIKKVKGVWVFYCTVDTPKRAVRKAAVFCSKLNSPSPAALIERGWLVPLGSDYFQKN